MTLQNGPLKSGRTAGQSLGARPPVAGLVGGMGAGKSWLGAALAREGARIIDADRVGHQALERPEVRARIVEAFGEVEDRTDPAPAGSRKIDRKALGAIVFADPGARERLEAIVHPVMVESFADEIRSAGSRAEGDRPWLVVLDAAILLEAGWDELCDLVVFVDCPEEVRHRRLREERGWTDFEIQKRERAQWPLDRKKERADLVVGPFRGESDVRLAVSRLREAARATGPIPPGPWPSQGPELASRS